LKPKAKPRSKSLAALKKSFVAIRKRKSGQDLVSESEVLLKKKQLEEKMKLRI